ncbi:LOG family protein [Candidatus Azambacteria bacterium]|nr:LOG family protein [Candidatus Azambacteria bacterium]
MTKKNHYLKDLEIGRHIHMKYKIAVSGAAETGHCGKGALEMAMEMGKEVVRQKGVLMTGATIGIPYWAARGAKEEGGISIGLSPAATERAHVKTYRLPTDYFDLIIYTGFDYSGRNLLLTRSADAVIVICGRMGTLNEFTIAFEDNKPIGVLEGTGGTADMIREIVGKTHRGPGKIVYDSDPKRLLEKLLKLVKKEKVILIKEAKTSGTKHSKSAGYGRE